MPQRKVAAKWIQNASDKLAIEQGCYFDPSIGKAACEFIQEFCIQSKGRWAGKPLILLDWQAIFLMRLFGWRAADGKRRFKRAYLEVAKKNGKTTLLSALALLLLIADGEGAPEVYVLAVDRDQASILFDESARMVRSSPEFASRLELVDSRKRIIDPDGNGRITAGSAEVSQKDGVSASCVIFDELHRQKTRAMWDIFEYSGASREQPLKISITTAGEDTGGIWHEQREYSEKVNAGVIPDITHLGVVYRALEEDDIDDPRTWAKANPSLGHTISIEDFRRELTEAKELPTKLANFKRLRLNIVARGEQAFCSIEQWDACNAHAILTATDPILGGLDLSQLDDLTALAIVSGDPGSDVNVEMSFWLPEEGIVDLEKRHQVPYRTWADMGLITLTPGNVIDYSFIRHQINALAQERDLLKLLIDPYNATKLGLELKEQDGLPVEYIRQGYLSLSGPTKELLRLILSGQLRHGGHPILRWHASNAVAEQDAAGNIKLSKRKSARKIDGLAALVNALAGFTSITSTASVYETKPLLVL
jgi:phage terminase large subunit-like protein